MALTDFGLARILMRQGDALDQRYELDRAVAKYRASVRWWPWQAAARMRLAKTLARQGNTGAAIVEAHELLRREPENAQAHAELAEILEGKSDREGATIEYRLALRLKPDLAEAHIGLGNLLSGSFDRSEIREGVKELQEAVRLQPDNAEAHEGLGLALEGLTLYQTVDPMTIIGEYRLALRLRPEDDLIHSLLAHALADRGQEAEAIQEYREAIRLRPPGLLDASDDHFKLGVLLLKAHDLNGAISEFEQLSQSDPKDSSVACLLNFAMNLKGDREAAAEQYRTATRADPGFPAACKRLLKQSSVHR